MIFVWCAGCLLAHVSPLLLKKKTTVVFLRCKRKYIRSVKRCQHNKNLCEGVCQALRQKKHEKQRGVTDIKYCDFRCNKKFRIIQNATNHGWKWTKKVYEKQRNFNFCAHFPDKFWQQQKSAKNTGLFPQPRNFEDGQECSYGSYIFENFIHGWSGGMYTEKKLLALTPPKKISETFSFFKKLIWP